MLKFDNLKYERGSKKKPKRVGRGHSSGQGKTCGRGHKGQKSRSGGGTRPGFEGGQTPFYRRLPKQHKFKNILFKKEYAILNVGALNEFSDGEEVGWGKSLPAGGFLKVLGEGELKKKVTVYAHKFSQTARDKIEGAGGKAVVIK